MNYRNTFYQNLGCRALKLLVYRLIVDRHSLLITKMFIKKIRMQFNKSNNRYSLDVSIDITIVILDECKLQAKNNFQQPVL